MQKLFLLFCFINMWAHIRAAPYNSSQGLENSILDLDEQLNNHEVNPEEEGSFFEGDIMLPDNKQKPFDMLRNGMIAEKYRWPNGVIPIEIVGDFSPYEMILLNRVFDEYHEKTCVQFVPHTTENDFLAINKHEAGCWSYVGRRTGRQELNFSSRCFPQYGTLLHEVMHALGFLHEQSRHERDDYVKVVVDNVRKGKLKNFQKISASVQTDYGVEYDYGSVMHYSPRAFSKNGEPTLVALDWENPDAERMGQRIGFSTGDLIKINSMYNCYSAEGSPESSSTEEY